MGAAACGGDATRPAHIREQTVFVMSLVTT
jgi:hypothetical protein